MRSFRETENEHFPLFRAVTVLPNRFNGVVGEHGAYPIEKIRLSPDKNILASCSHDLKIKFWDVTGFKENTFDCEKKGKRKRKSHQQSDEVENFFSDL